MGSDAVRLQPERMEEYRRAIARLPVTMRPALNQQLNGWANLFPYEQNRFVEFVGGVTSFSPAQWETLVQPLRALEAKMGVAEWRFSESADTMANASQLARSPYYAEWRHEVQRVFSAVEAAARRTALPRATAGRLVVLVLPQSLPVPALHGRKPWDSRAVEFKIAGDPQALYEAAVGASGLPMVAEKVAAETSGRGAAESSDRWIIDADAQSSRSRWPGSVPACVLDYAALKAFRDEFLSKVNTVPKDIEGTDEILARVRHENWDRSWPAGLGSETRLRSFVIDLFLSGNGALIFPNSFVQWASTEALRRARPRLLIARFGMRSKPKPFTSIAIFENQQKISAMHDVDDPEGSAVDAHMLARYVWLSAMRFPEQEQTSCICISEASGTVSLIAPERKRPNWPVQEPVAPEAISAWMQRQLLEG